MKTEKKGKSASEIIQSESEKKIAKLQSLRKTNKSKSNKKVLWEKN